MKVSRLNGTVINNNILKAPLLNVFTISTQSLFEIINKLFTKSSEVISLSVMSDVYSHFLKRLSVWIKSIRCSFVVSCALIFSFISVDMPSKQYQRNLFILYQSNKGTSTKTTQDENYE